MKRSILLSFMTILLLPCLGFASTLTYDSSPTILDTQTDWEKTISFQKFDPMLGMLNSISIAMTSNGQTELTVTNTGTQKSSGHASTELTITLSDINGVLYTLTDTPILLNFHKLVSNSSATTGMQQFSTSFTQSYTASSVLQSFTGSGVANLVAEAIALTSVVYGGGNISSVQNTWAGLAGTITYDYTPAPPHTPEPATLLLMGSGLVGMVYARKRQRKSGV